LCRLFLCLHCGGFYIFSSPSVVVPSMTTPWSKVRTRPPPQKSLPFPPTRWTCYLSPPSPLADGFFSPAFSAVCLSVKPDQADKASLPLFPARLDFQQVCGRTSTVQPPFLENYVRRRWLFLSPSRFFRTENQQIQRITSFFL